jgi:hypothetical protein
VFPMGIRFIRGSRLGTRVSSQRQLRIQYRVPIAVRRASGIGAQLPVLQAPRSGKCCPIAVIEGAVRRECSTAALTRSVGPPR